MNKRPTWEAGDYGATAKRRSYRLTSLEALRATMLAHGFTSGYQLAKASGLGVATVNHLVHGHRKTASAKTVGLLREVFGRDGRDLFVPEASTVHIDRNRAA